MPLYEYKCAKCGDVFELIQKFSDEPVTVHEGCGGAVEKLISAPAFQFKGTGWYATDYAKGSTSRANGASKAESSSEGEKSSESKSESKTEGKTETKAETKSESKPAPAGCAPGRPSRDGGRPPMHRRAQIRFAAFIPTGREHTTTRHRPPSAIR